MRILIYFLLCFLPAMCAAQVSAPITQKDTTFSQRCESTYGEIVTVSLFVTSDSVKVAIVPYGTKFAARRDTGNENEAVFLYNQFIKEFNNQ